MQPMKLPLLLVSVIIALTAVPNNTEDSLLVQLDSYVARRGEFEEQRLQRIDSLKLILDDMPETDGIVTLNDIFLEYFAFSYDSALVYLRKEQALAAKKQDKMLVDWMRISHALLLSTSGFYSQAESLMLSLDEATYPSPMRYYYYFVMTWLYDYWSVYCSDDYFAPKYAQTKLGYINKAINELDNVMLNHEPHTAVDTLMMRMLPSQERVEASRSYLLAERMSMQKTDSRKCVELYKHIMSLVSVNDRLYAYAAHGAAKCYKRLGDNANYVKFLVEAAISDIICPSNESVALQELSLYLFKNDPIHAERSLRYVQYSMEDAQFYNNRLRILEISKIMPMISASYEEEISRQETVLRYILIVISILVICLLTQIIYTSKQNRKIKLSRLETNAKMAEVQALNERLEATNSKRETYLRLFMEIGATFIRKIGEYRKLVSQKVKAGQSAELLRMINSYKVVEEESATFNALFDRAFLELYPNFINELNELLLDDQRIVMPSPTSLTTEARIFALMRLGVTESSKIATLLFYSPQTIYNYRTSIRSKAKNRDTFDDDINKLCKIIP